MKTNKLFRLFIVVITILMAFSVSQPAQVKAQSGTTLSILPSNPTVCLNDEVTLQVQVDGVVDMFAMDLRLSFDPGNIEILEISQGPFLDAGFLIKNEYNNATGTIRYAMTQVAPSTPKSGSGVLLNIRLRVINLSALPVAMTISITPPTVTELSAVGGVVIPFTVASNASIITSACVAAISVTPAIAAGSMCFETIVKVHVADVNDLYGFTLDMTFDPAVIEILGVTNGGFLTYAAPFLNIYSNSAGTITYVAYQTSPTLPKSGAGDLISIRLRGKVVNSSSALTVLASSILTTIDGNLIPYTITNGIVTTDACNPTAVVLRSFTTTRANWAVTLKWVTASESNNLGFNLYRSTSLTGRRYKVNPELIRSKYPGSPLGASYSYVDKGRMISRTFYYWLEAVGTRGNATSYGPFKASRIVRLQ